MKILLYSIAALLLLSGCSQKLSDAVPNYALYQVPSIKTDKATVEDMSKDGKIFKVTTTIDGKVRKKGAMLLVVSTMRKAVQETKARGYRYFQIIAPAELNNAAGFPINNIADLASFLVPQTNNVPKAFNGLENAIDTHPALDIPLTIFGDSKFSVVVQIIEDPKYYDIVWDTERY